MCDRQREREHIGTGITAMDHNKILLYISLSSKRAVDESEVEVAERRNLRCVWVSGGRALTELEAAKEIVSEARLLLREDLAQLGVQWDPGTLPPEAPPSNNPDERHRSHSDSGSSDTSTGSSHSSPETQTHISPRRRQEGNGSKRTDRRGLRDRQGERMEEHCRRDNGEARRRGKGKKEVRQKEGVNGEQGKRGVERREAERTEKEQIKEDRGGMERGEPENKGPAERQTEAKPIEGRNVSQKVATTRDTEIPDEERGADEMKRFQKKGEESKKIEQGDGSGGVVAARLEGHTKNHSVPERSLTQELAEIVSTPLPQPQPLPQPSPSPKPPPRFRAPASRVEEPHCVPGGTLKRDGTTGPGASPVQPGRTKQSRALSKVLRSIHSETSTREKVGVAQTSPQLRLNPTEDALAPGPTSAVPGRVPITSHALAQKPPSTPITQNIETTEVPIPRSQPISPAHKSAPAHSFSPEAKRRRIEGQAEDVFSSPELYVGEGGNEEGEGAEEGDEGAVKEEEEGFGDSFELDTQTERIILQQVYRHRDKDEGVEQVREERMEEVDLVVERENTQGSRARPVSEDKRGNQERGDGTKTPHTSLSNKIHSNPQNQDAPVSPHSAGPRFNISLTDSQMEHILNSGRQVSGPKH